METNEIKRTLGLILTATKVKPPTQPTCSFYFAIAWWLIGTLNQVEARAILNLAKTPGGNLFFLDGKWQLGTSVPPDSPVAVAFRELQAT